MGETTYLPPRWLPQTSMSAAPQSLLGKKALQPTDQRRGMNRQAHVPYNWITAPSETMSTVPCRRQSLWAQPHVFKS